MTTQRSSPADVRDVTEAFRRFREGMIPLAAAAQNISDALRDDSPAHMWPEAHNPANQWLANHRGRRRAAQEVTAAGECARAYVWAAMHPEATQATVWRESAKAGARGRPDVAKAFRYGWTKHHPARCVRACEFALEVAPEYAGTAAQGAGRGGCAYYLREGQR